MSRNIILGAISGDIIGSAYEFNNIKSLYFEILTNDTFFTDDSVMTIGTMYVLLNSDEYSKTYHSIGRRFPHRAYGSGFKKWLISNNPQPYNSFGNGSAMRVSPIGWYCKNIDEVLAEAKRSAEVTHNHPEGIKGAQAAALAVFWARTGKSKKDIKTAIEEHFSYDLSRKIDKIRPVYKFDESCQGTVPEAIIAFLESKDYEHAVRLAVSLGGDSDTLAAITGGIAEAFYKEIPEDITDFVRVILGPDLMKDIIIPFSEKYGY